MKAVVGVLVLLLNVSHGDETCDGRKDGVQCYGALGGPAVLQLMDDASEIDQFQWQQNKTITIINWNNKIITYHDQIKNRFTFIQSNGTLMIQNLSRTDGGQYILKTYGSDGSILKNRTLQLTIQAPVSAAQLDTECLSQGVTRAFCSSEGGDSPEYRWTLEGHTVTDAQLQSGSSTTRNITLKQVTSGHLECSISNHVSHVSDGQEINTCGFTFIECYLPNGTYISQWVPEANNTLCIQSTTSTTEGKTIGISNKPSTNNTSFNQTSSYTDASWYKRLTIMAGALSALVFLLVAGVAFVCVHKKKQKSRTRAEEDDQELTYASVTIQERQGRPMARKAENEVEYGQVNFSHGQMARQTSDDCVYAQFYQTS